MNLNKYTEFKEIFEQSSIESSEILILEKKLEDLKMLCQELNPFAKISVEMRNRLRSFNLHEIDDPFLLTNHMIMLTEDTIEKLEILKAQSKS